MSPTIPKTCRAVVLEKAGAPWVIKEVPVEEPKHGEVLIKVDACGVCHSDSFLQQGAFGEGYAILTPLLCLKDVNWIWIGHHFLASPVTKSSAQSSQSVPMRADGRRAIRSAEAGMEDMMAPARRAIGDYSRCVRTRLSMVSRAMVVVGTTPFFAPDRADMNTRRRILYPQLRSRRPYPQRRRPRRVCAAALCWCDCFQRYPPDENHTW
jgi:hypothetical protein